jgi:ketosteroid isomerase-like protein
MKDAFLANLADDAIIFRPGPVKGIPWFRDRPANAGTLSWEPDFAALSESGDLGYTSGPWEYKDKGATQPVHGHFVSVWRKQPDGAWKVAIDAGAAHAPPTGTARLVLAPREPAKKVAWVASEEKAKEMREAWLAADRDLARAIDGRTDYSKVFAGHCSEDVRLYRPGAHPVVGHDAVESALAARPGLWTWTPMMAGTSVAGDLGYTYGTATFHPEGAPPDSVEATAYLRIWRHTGRHVVLDVANPMPAAKKSVSGSKTTNSRKK